MSFSIIRRKDKFFTKVYTLNDIICTVKYIMGIGVVKIDLKSQSKRIILQPPKYKFIPIIGWLLPMTFKIQVFDLKENRLD